MATITEMINRFKLLDLEDHAIKALSRTSETAADLQAEQMFKGIDSTGANINPSYSRKTVRIKKEKGQPSDRVTLRDTGKFYSKIYVKVSAAGVDFGSNDDKTEDLKNKYGDEIFGLSDKFKAEYLREYLGPAFFKSIREKIQL